MRDLFILVGALGVAIAFGAVWAWIWRKLDDVPADFRPPDEWWGL